MIWIVLTILVLACGLYISSPLSGRAGSIDRRKELKAYSDEIIALDCQDLTPAIEARKVMLQRRVLDITDANDRGPASEGGFKGVIAAILGSLLIGSAGLYAYLGRPDLASGSARIADNIQNPPSESELVARMEGLLKAEPDNVNAWTLYARLLMNMGRMDEGLAAYAKAVSIGNSPDLTAEYESAQAFAAQAKAAQNLPAQDRMAMITGMVDSLAARLEDDPENPEGWVRILTSRRVLGQTDELAADLKTVRAVYADRPDVLGDILTRSGSTEK